MESTKTERGLAVITGASAGLGEAFARELARRGHDLLLVARRGDRLTALAAELRERHGCRADVLVADLSRPEGPRALLTRLDEGPCPTLLVNNAGSGQAGRTLDAPVERMIEMIRLNAEAPTVLTVEVVRRMLAKNVRGGVINVSSTSAFAGAPFLSVYSGTKGYQLLFTEALAAELEGTGIRMLTLCPGYTETEFHTVANLRARPPKSMIATAEACARAGLDAYEAGRTTYVHGTLNRLSVLVGRLLPRSVVVAATGKAMSSD